MNLDGSVYSSHMQFWGTGYADLPAAAYSDGSNRFAEVTLTPKSGEAVTLNAFDMAAYPTGISGRDESEISIIYGNKLISYGPTTLSGNSVTHFTPSVTYTGPITIRFGTDWDNGINNINFNATAVPEPSTYGLMATAIMGLLCYRNRKQ